MVNGRRLQSNSTKRQGKSTGNISEGTRFVHLEVSFSMLVVDLLFIKVHRSAVIHQLARLDHIFHLAKNVIFPQQLKIQTNLGPTLGMPARVWIMQTSDIFQPWQEGSLAAIRIKPVAGQTTQPVGIETAMSKETQ